MAGCGGVDRVAFVFRPRLPRCSDTLRPEHGQAFAVPVEVAEREAGAQPVEVLGQAAVSRLLESEDALQYPERMFYLGPDARLTPILCAL